MTNETFLMFEDAFSMTWQKIGGETFLAKNISAKGNNANHESEKK